jgi:hypothetical protein
VVVVVDVVVVEVVVVEVVGVVVTQVQPGISSSLNWFFQHEYLLQLTWSSSTEPGGIILPHGSIHGQSSIFMHVSISLRT